MKNNRPELTGAQYEIVQLAWESDHPLTVTELWQELSKDREIARTTVLTWVQRLEKRGWLKRVETEGGLGYHAAAAPDDGATTAAERVMNTLFKGSPSGLMMALAGRGHIDEEELERMKELLRELEAKRGS